MTETKRQKTGGRAAGTPNRVTSELRDALKAIIAKEFETLPDRLAQLPDRERLELVLKLMPFCLPKVGPIEGSYDSPFSWDFGT